jgi:ADP-heptose:LPS heptosyltransferase
MINQRCRHFRGSRPCVFNKADGSECPNCLHADAYRERILFIKLDAIGDVLRSASLLPAIRAKHEAPFIAWVTRSDAAELVGIMEGVDEVIELSPGSGLARVMAGGWDQVYSVSNDAESAALATVAAAGRSTPVGFYMADGIMRPSNEAAAHWLEMAAFDRLKRGNSQSYQRHMLDIIGSPEMAITPPVLRVDAALCSAAAARLDALFGARRRRVAINIGSGSRWPKKMLEAAAIYRYARLLTERANVDIVLVGGRDEAEKAAAIIAMGAPGDRIGAALTETSTAEFVATLMQVDALMTGDTLALHIASAIGLPTVAVFGPTSPAEIFDFDGLIAKTWTERLDCLVCYGDCRKAENCMSLLDPAALVELTMRQLERVPASVRAT